MGDLGDIFGTLTGYLLHRLVIWAVLAAVLLLLTWLSRRSLPIGRLALTAILLEVITTIGSIVFRESEPRYGIFYASFWKYFIARFAIWTPLACFLLWQWTRMLSNRTAALPRLVRDEHG